MRRGVMVTVLVIMVTTLLPASEAAGRTPISVRPRTGRATTTYVVRFRHPDRTGQVGALRQTDWLRVSGTGARRNCVTRGLLILPAAGRGRVATIRLRLRHFGHARRCAGRFRGLIRESSAVICVSYRVCPLPAIIWRTVARFSFRVRRAPREGGGSGSGGDASPTATTAPGATSYTLYNFAGRAAYFVVRARDQAGREDHNTVERQAVNFCG